MNKPECNECAYTKLSYDQRCSYCSSCSRSYEDMFIHYELYDYMIDRIKDNLKTIKDRSCVFSDKTCYNRSIDVCLRCDHVGNLYLSEQGDMRI